MDERTVHGEHEVRGKKGARVKLQRLTPAVLFVFLAGLASTAAGEGLHPSTGTDEVHHAEGSACPDPGDDGAPCGPACLCTCCPGQMTATAIAPVHPFIAAPRGNELEAAWVEALHPKDVFSSIFRPPRA